MAGAVAGGLLLAVNVMQWFAGGRPGDDPSGLYSSMVLAALLIIVGTFYVVNRQRAAASKARLIREGRILSGWIMSCTARAETTTEASLGEVTRSYMVT